MSDDKKYTLEELLSLLNQADECLEDTTLLSTPDLISLCVARNKVVNKLIDIRDNLNTLLVGEYKL